MINNNLPNMLSVNKEKAIKNRKKSSLSNSMKDNKETFNDLLVKKSGKISDAEKTDQRKNIESIPEDNLNKVLQEKKSLTKDSIIEKKEILSEDEINIEDIITNLQINLDKIKSLLSHAEDNDEDFKLKISEMVNIIDNITSAEIEGIIVSPKELTALNSISQLLNSLENNSMDLTDFKSEMYTALNNLKLSANSDLENQKMHISNSQSDFQIKEVKEHHDTIKKVTIDEVKVQNNETNSKYQNKDTVITDKTTSSDESNNLSKENIYDKSNSLYFKLKENTTESKKTEDIKSIDTSDVGSIKNIYIEDVRTPSYHSIAPPQNSSNLKSTIFNQIMENFKLTLNNDSSEILIKLKPDNLGDLTMKLIVERGIVIAKFDVESQIVKQTIETNLEDLKNSLNDKGFQIQELNVSVNKDPKQRHSFFNYKQKKKGLKRISNIGKPGYNSYENINYIGNQRSLDDLSSKINYLA